MTIIKYETIKEGTKYEYRTYIKRFGRAIQVHRRGFKTYEAAKKAEAKMIYSGGKEYSSNISFKELYEEYFKAYELRNKMQSIRKTKSYFKLHILPFFQDAIVNKISINDYMDWQQIILGKNFSDSYNKGLHTAMVSILRFGQRNYNVGRNVAQEVGGFKKKNIKKKTEVWGYDEYKRFISVIDNIRDKALFSLMYETGVRFGEAASLTFDDYYGSYIEIIKTVAKEKDANNNDILNSPKTPSSIRRITLSDNIIDLINQMKEYYSKCIGFDNKWYIFGGVKPYAHTTATNHKNKYCALSGVKQITLHEFRHSHASMLLNTGIPIADISERLGHSNPGITLGIYSHMIKKTKDPIVDALNKLNS